VQVGDWGYTWPGYQSNHSLHKLQKMLQKHDMPMLWLDGNHENYTDLQKRGFWQADKMCPFEDANLIQYIPRGHAWEWDGVVYMAMGGAFSIDQGSRVEGKSWWREELISYADLETAATTLDRIGKVDVFLSHDCPEGVEKLETYLELTSKEFNINYKLDESSRSNRHALWQVVERAKPDLLIHGHYHWPYTAVKEWDGHKMQVAGLDCNGTAKSFTILDMTVV